MPHMEDRIALDAVQTLSEYTLRYDFACRRRAQANAKHEANPSVPQHPNDSPEYHDIQVNGARSDMVTHFEWALDKLGNEYRTIKTTMKQIVQSEENIPDLDIQTLIEQLEVVEKNLKARIKSK